MQKARNGRIAGRCHWLLCEALGRKKGSGAVLRSHLRLAAVKSLPFPDFHHLMKIDPIHEYLLDGGRVYVIGQKQLYVKNISTF